ncbi:ABC transporter ATP-binding protein [Austwickia chelonae]|uniref:ABC transporter ATP-binding protein n=1 Tax=Austwickia chelonae TaxID=100225 RepID=UPI0013C34B28|nr:ABC transporter ATP-binding protein [Austwickia chelonae]
MSSHDTRGSDGSGDEAIEQLDGDELTLIQRLGAMGNLAKLSFTAAPLAVTLAIVGAILDALLPIVTTFFAARTTTALGQVVAKEPGAVDQVFVYITLTAGVGLLTALWSSISIYVHQKLVFSVECRISDKMFDRFASLAFWRYEDKSTADLYDRAARFAKNFAQAFDKIAVLFGALIAVVLSLAALAIVNPWLALAVLVAVTPGMWLQFQLTRKQWAHWNGTIETRRRRVGIEQRMLHPKAIVELRSYGLVRHLLALRATLRDRDERERLDQEREYILKRLLADAVEALVEVGALVWVTLRISAGTQSLGQFVFVQQVVRRAIEAANQFVTAVAEVDQDVVNLFDYQRFMQLDDGPPPINRVPAPMPDITLEKVAFRYPGADRPLVLRDISLQIPAGHHVALVGENGAGKSTLLKLILGIYRPETGRVLIGGQDLAECEPATWHTQVALLKQDFLHYSFATIRENVAWGAVDRPVDEASIWEALNKAQLAGFVRTLPHGLDTYVDPWMEDEEGRIGTDLSGGQWQRLALARAFYRDAKVIVLDEPTSALDALAEKAIYDHFFALGDRTLISISHRLTSVARTDVIHVLVDGQIVESGSHEELVALQGHYVRIFASQLTPGLQA